MEAWSGAESPEFSEDSRFRGLDGPLGVRNGPFKNPLYSAFVSAGVQAGYGGTSSIKPLLSLY